MQYSILNTWDFVYAVVLVVIVSPIGLGSGIARPHLYAFSCRFRQGGMCLGAGWIRG